MPEEQQPSINPVKPAVIFADLVKKKNFLSWISEPVVVILSRFNRTTKIMIAVAVALFGIIILVAIIGLIFSGLRNRGNGTALPQATPISGEIPQTAPLKPSRYATDPDVLSIENSLKDLEGELNKIEVKDSYLTLPKLEFNINFKK